MTSNTYVIDSSSLIELHRHNPIDVYRTVWKHMETLIKKNQLVAPKEVLNEITSNDDNLSKWAKTHQELFLELDQTQIPILKDVLKEYPSLSQEGRKYAADAFVVALAKTMSSPQTLTSMKIIVVTDEKIRGNKIKIPFVCKKYGIQAIDIIEMFRMEGWKF